MMTSETKTTPEAKTVSAEKSIKISPEVALPEFLMLSDHWQNRALILAQDCALLRQENAELKEALKALEPPADDEVDGGDADGTADDANGEGGDA